MMGTKFIYERTGAGLFNCAFRSTKDLGSKGGYLFAWMMDALMVGIGVGFDTLGAGTFTIKEPQWTNDIHMIEDSREGWVNSVHLLLDGFFLGKKVPQFRLSHAKPFSVSRSSTSIGMPCSASCRLFASRLAFGSRAPSCSVIEATSAAMV